MYDLIIIGAGPAGLSAAVYGRRAGLDLIVIEQTPMGGGQVVDTYEVDNYLGMPGVNGFDLAQKFRSHADGLGTVFKSGRVTAVRDEGARKVVETADGTSYEARTLILAGGAEHAKLGVPGKRNIGGRACPTVRPATALSLRRETWRLWAAATWRWRMPSILQGSAVRFI